MYVTAENKNISYLPILNKKPSCR